MKKNNVVYFLPRFVKGIPVTQQSLFKELEKLPNHPGLFEINDALTAFHITATADHIFVSRNINGYGS